MNISIEDAIKNQKKLFQQAFNIYNEEKLEGKISIVGMGGSSIAAKILKHFYSLPIEILNEPLTAKKRFDNLILVSYSGNTIEVLTYKKAEANNIITITSGGKLKEIAKRQNWHLIELPKGYYPRSSLPFMLIPLSQLLGLKLENEFNKAKKAKIEGKIEKTPIICMAYERYKGLTERAKTQINENAKIPAFLEILPEAMHNCIEALKHESLLFVGEPTNNIIKASLTFLKQHFSYLHIKSTNLFEIIEAVDELSLKLAKAHNTNPEKLNYINSYKSFLRKYEKTFT